MIAAAYADLRDRRMALTAQEADLKRRALALLRQFKKTRYHRNGIDIELLHGADDVKVKVAKRLTTIEVTRRDGKSAAAGD